MTLNRRQTLLALLCLASASARAQPLEPPLMLEGQPFARQAQVAGSELLLNGVGLRAVAWFKGYAAGLYLSEPARTAKQALARPGPKRVQLRMLVSVSAQEFHKAMKKGIDRNTPEAERPALAQRVQRFGELIAATGQVNKGDVIDLDLDPQRGLIFALNGTARGEPIAGADFYAAVLRSFIGEHPYDKELRAGMLNPPQDKPPGRAP